MLLLKAAPTVGADLVRIQFALPQGGPVDLSVFDAAGRQVNRLMDGWATAGTHVLQWNRASGNGTMVPDGVYFVRLRANGAADAQRIILTR